MAVDSYSTLKTEISNYLDESYDAANVDTFIDLAEDRINRDLRIAAMETALSVTIASGVAAIPTGFRELKSAYVDSNPTSALEMVPLSSLYRDYPTRSSSGKPIVMAVEGSNFAFGPYPDSTYTIKGTYYKAFTALSTSNETNWLTSDAKALLLYACLTHAAEFSRDDEANKMWSARYENERKRVEKENDRYRFGHGISLRAVAR